MGLVGKCLPQDLVFREEATQWKESRDGKRADRHHPECPRDELPQAAHVAYVLFAAERVNHRTCCKEEQCLKEGVSHEVKDACRERCHSASHEHVAELRNGRVGKNTFDVVLNQANTGCEDRSQRTDDRNYAHGYGSMQKQNVRARDHVYTRRHHGRGVNQRRNGSGAFHRIG